MKFSAVLFLALGVAAQRNAKADKFAENVEESDTQDALSTPYSCYPSSGKGYIGLASTTKSGKTCQNWLDEFPEEIKGSHQPDGFKDHNYCRQIKGGEVPKCYPLSGGGPEACAIDECPQDKTVDRMESARDEMLTALGADPSAQDCKCADALFGSTATSDDTSIAGTGRALLQTKVGIKIDGVCHCH